MINDFKKLFSNKLKNSSQNYDSFSVLFKKEWKNIAMIVNKLKKAQNNLKLQIQN